jgi:hypothetical protein
MNRFGGGWRFLFTWKVALDYCGVEVVVLLETSAVDVVEGVEAEAAVCGYQGNEGKKGVEELHCAFLVVGCGLRSEVIISRWGG